jgi:SNF2 family DNA or RNA helicase
MIRIEKRGRRIEVHSEEHLPGMKTAIPGAYQTTGGYWTVPLSVESCKLLKEKYGSRLIAGNELKRWVRGAQAARRSMAKLSTQSDAKLYNLRRKAPHLYKAMSTRRYQRVGARFIADNHATLVADEPGLGKTLMAMGGILEAELPGPYLVVAPKTAAESVWQREIERWLPKPHRAITMPEMGYERDDRLRRLNFGPHTWVIVHPEMVLTQVWWICQDCDSRTPAKLKQRQLKCGHTKTNKTQKLIHHNYPKLFRVNWGVIICDESHDSLIRRSGVPTQRRRGLEMLPLRNDGIRIAMSGTPFNSKPHHLWGTLNWLDSQTYSAYNRWAELYWQKGGYTGFDLGEFRQDREKMLWESLSAVCIRRTKAEVAPDLPDKMDVGTPLDPNDPASPTGVWLEMHGKQAKAYEQMAKLSVTELDSGRLSARTALAELTRLKQLACSYGDIKERKIKVRCTPQERRIVPCIDCEEQGWHPEAEFKYHPTLPSNKFDWIAENLEEWGYPNDPLTKVVIVSFYTGILNAFAAGLEKHFKTKPQTPLCTAITGLTPAKERRGIIDRFNSGGGPDVMMLNVKAGGTAITLDAADRMIFISETRIPDQQIQAEDRIHRVSNPRQCMYYYLRSVGTVDVGTAVVNAQMRQDSHRLLDQRRGIDYLRRVMELSR